MYTCWHIPPKELSLPLNEVHIWRVSLEPPSEFVQRCESVLSLSERTRAQRYIFEQHRRRWTIARATLRLLLGHYLNREPTLFEFDLNEFGKPSLATLYKETHIKETHIE